MTKNSNSKDYVVYGRITYSESGNPAAGILVTAMDSDFLFDDRLGHTETDGQGKFRISYSENDFRDFIEHAPDIYLLIYDKDGCLLTTTVDSVIRNAGRRQEIHVQLPGKDHEPIPATINIGGTAVQRKTFEELDPETLLGIADFALQDRGESKFAKIAEKLSAELSLERLRAEFCFTPLVRFLRETIRFKKWPRDIALRLEDIIIGYQPSSSYASYSCPNFTITYQTSGDDQPPATDTGGNITMPGTGAVVGTTTGGDGIPDYIEKLCFWLNNALSAYTNAPFNLRNPASGGAIPVTVTGTSPGFAGGGSMIIGRNLNDDLLAAVPTHELMHLIQELYEGAGTTGGWNPGMVEGGAVLGEDVVFDTHNRYIVQATSPGILATPGTSLNNLSYFLAFFLKYISEQQSARVNPADEPEIGVDTYRQLLERFDTDGYTTAAFEAVVGHLPFYQHFFKFHYLDTAKLDETSSETMIGNFWLACYLKELGSPVQINGISERRFDFMEDEEDATWDSIFLGSDSVSTLGSVSLTVDTTLNSGATITLSSGSGGSVSPFAARFYKVQVDSAVDTLRVDFSAGIGFARPIVQIVLIESGNNVRDILRTDKTTWSRTIANNRAGSDLEQILIVVAGTDSGGSFSLTTQEVAATSDVMVTRWHHLAGSHYEIDSFGWTWTWVSPDIWVDNNGNGLADSEVFFAQNNKLFVRLHNQGHADASSISVALWYQDAAGGLSDSAWLPVQNTANVTQTLTGLSLAAGADNQWSVDWAPTPSGTSKHFCVRAIVTVPGESNTDNKRCLSNFGNVITGAPYIDLPLIRRFPEEIPTYPPYDGKKTRIDVIPRTNGQWFISEADITRSENIHLNPGQEVTDMFRMRRRAELKHQSGELSVAAELTNKHPCSFSGKESRLERKPDRFGHYPTDPRALPPGLKDVPLITIAHIVDGEIIGGFTWALREK